jgi:hypothetical protein
MNTVRQTEISVRLGWERTKYHKRAYRHTRFSISNHIGTAQQGRTNNVLAPEEPDVYRGGHQLFGAPAERNVLVDE